MKFKISNLKQHFDYKKKLILKKVSLIKFKTDTLLEIV